MASGAELYTLHADALAGARSRPDPDPGPVPGLRAAVGHGRRTLWTTSGAARTSLALDPHSLDEVLETLRVVADRTGVAAARERAGRRPSGPARPGGRRRGAGGRGPRVAVVEWVDPPFTAGHWVPDLVLAAGGEPVAASPGRARSSRPGPARGGTAGRRARVAVRVPPRRRRRSGRDRPRRPAAGRRRSGRSTRTASWCGPVPGWSTGSRRSPGCCTPTGFRRRGRRPCARFAESLPGSTYLPMLALWSSGSVGR